MLARVGSLTLGLLLATGCKGKTDDGNSAPAGDHPAGAMREFKGARADKVVIEGFEVPVPDGYRQASELAHPAREASLLSRVPIGGKAFVSEREHGGLIALATIAKAFEATAERCRSIGETAASEAKQQLAGVEIVKARGGSACFVTLGSTVGKLYEYYIPGTAKTLLVVCMPDDSTADTIGPVDCAAAALGTKAG